MKTENRNYFVLTKSRVAGFLRRKRYEIGSTTRHYKTLDWQCLGSREYPRHVTVEINKHTTIILHGAALKGIPTLEWGRTTRVTISTVTEAY